MTYLGYANGWTTTPSLVKEAKANGYVLVSQNIGHCLTRYICTELDFYYDVDSSD